MFEVYAPLAVYQLTGLVLIIAVILAVWPANTRALMVFGFVVVIAVQVWFWFSVVGTVRRGLRAGVATPAEVVSPGSFSTSPRVRVNGREMTLRSGSARNMKAGDRVRVITNETGDKLLLSLVF